MNKVKVKTTEKKDKKTVAPARIKDAKKRTSKPTLNKDKSPEIKAFDLLLADAAASKVSDLHIEPQGSFVLVRYRIDGVLHEANRLKADDATKNLIRHIKTLAHLPADKHHLPQNSQVTIKVNEGAFTLDISTLPTINGEKIVIKLTKKTKLPTLKELGLWGNAKKEIESSLANPGGMYLINGLAKSGKSITSLNLLNLLNNPGINISTLENSTNHTIVGLNRVKINAKAGMTPINGLKAILNQDSDTIMAEICSSEMANLEIKAALGGKTVISPFCANQAVSGITRLMAMGIEPFLIAHVLKIATGQRLVRKLCVSCREEYAPGNKEIQQIAHTIENNTKSRTFTFISELEASAIEEKLGGDTPAQTTANSIKSLWRKSKNGCKKCRGTGFSGQIGLFEVLPNSDEIQKLILARADAKHIKAKAIEQSMITMRVDGLIKALRGIIPIEEIFSDIKSGKTPCL